MKKLFLTTALLPSAFTAPALADTIVIKDFIGTVTIETSESSPLDITRQKNSGGIDISTASGLRIDGGINEPDSKKCKNYYGSFDLSWFGKKKKDTVGGYEDLDEYPNLTISAPSDVDLIIENSIIFAEIGDIGSADVQAMACSEINLGNIGGKADLSISGSGDVKAGDAKDVNTRVSGSGDLSMGSIADGEFRISGSGGVELGDSTSLNIRISGSGDLEAEDVNGPVYVRGSGSGDVEIDSVTGPLEFEGSGSGGLSVDRVDGDLDIRVSGSSDVDIDDGTVGFAKIYASGASDARFDGTADTADLKASGASDIYVYRVTGDAQTSESSASDVSIGNR